MRILEQVFFERAGIYRRSASLFEGLNAAYMIKMTSAGSNMIAADSPSL